MWEININLKENKELKKYELVYDQQKLQHFQDLKKKFTEQNQDLIFIPIFGVSGCGKSTISSFLVSHFQGREYEGIATVFDTENSGTRGINGYLIENCQLEGKKANILILDCEGFDGEDEIDEDEEISDEQKLIKQTYLKKLVLDLIQISHFPFYVTKDSRIDFENVPYLSETEVLPYHKKINLVFNRLSQSEIKHKKNQMDEMTNKFRSVSFIKQNNQQIKNQDFKDLVDKFYQIPQQLKPIGIEDPQNYFNFLENMQLIKEEQQSQSDKLIEIVLNEEQKKYDLKINLEILEKIQNIAKEKKLTIYCFLGKAGQGKSTIANTLLKKLDSSIQQDVFDVGHGFESKTQGADCFMINKQGQYYLLIDLEGLFASKSVSKDFEVQLSYLFAIFNLQCIIQMISTTSFYVQKSLRVLQKDTDTLKIINELIQQQFADENQEPTWNSIFIFNQLNESEKNLINNNKQSSIKTIREMYKQNISAVRCFEDDEDGDDDEEKQQKLMTNQGFDNDIKDIVEKASKQLEISDKRINGMLLAKKLKTLVNQSNNSVFSLGVLKCQQKQFEKLAAVRQQSDKIIEELSQKMEKFICEQTQSIVSQKMLDLMMNQTNKQKLNFIHAYYKKFSNQNDESDEEMLVLKQIQVRKKIVQLYFSQNPNSLMQEEYNYTYNKVYHSNNHQENQLYEMSEIGQFTKNIELNKQFDQLQSYRVEMQQYRVQKDAFNQVKMDDYKQSHEYQILKDQKRQIENGFEQQKQVLKDTYMRRQQIAVAGLAGGVAAQILVSIIEGKYKRNKKQILVDGVKGLAIGGAMTYVSSLLSPQVKLGIFVSMAITQSIQNFANPYRNKTSKIQQAKRQMTELTATLGFVTLAGYGFTYLAVGAGAAAFGAAFVGVAAATYYTNQRNKNLKLKQQKSIIDFLVKCNLFISQDNIKECYDILQLKHDAFQTISNKNSNLLTDFLPYDLQKQEEFKFKQNDIDQIQKMRLFVHFVISTIGNDKDIQQKNTLNEDQQKELNDIVSDLEAFTFYFDFDFIEIGQSLYQVTEKIRSSNNITPEKIKGIIKNIRSDDIDQNNCERQDQLRTKKFCSYESLQNLLSQNKLDSGLLYSHLPACILNLISKQNMDLWSTYICIQLLNPSFVFNSIFLTKVNYDLENDGVFMINFIKEYRSMFANLAQEYRVN